MNEEDTFNALRQVPVSEVTTEVYVLSANFYYGNDVAYWETFLKVRGWTVGDYQNAAYECRKLGLDSKFNKLLWICNNTHSR